MITLKYKNQSIDVPIEIKTIIYPIKDCTIEFEKNRPIYDLIRQLYELLEEDHKDYQFSH